MSETRYAIKGAEARGNKYNEAHLTVKLESRISSTTTVSDYRIDWRQGDFLIELDQSCIFPI